MSAHPASAPRLPRPMIAALVLLTILWVAALGVLARARTGAQFPAGEAVDARFSARPGVNLKETDVAGPALDATLERLAIDGAGYVRFTLPWDQAEPRQGQFEWAPWDRVADAFARQPSLTPVVVLDRSPEWARAAADAGNPAAPPHERRDFGAFARAVAERYKGRFAYYQVWDEPNIAPHWGTSLADPEAYTGLLREGAVNIRSANPNATIIAAALAPTTESGGVNLSDIAFLDQLYSLGGREWFDYPAAEPYGFSQPPDAASDPGQLNFGRAALLRQVMLRHSDGATPLWATAFGWDASASSGLAPWGTVSEAEQASYTKAAFDRAAKEWPWLGPMLWTANFPMLPATEAAMAQAAGPVAVLGPGSHASDSPALQYSGWRVTPSAADPSADGDTVDFRFDGTGVALEVQGGPYWAYLTATVDGAPANRLPRDETGASYLVLHDPAAAVRVEPLANGLPAGEHTVRLTAHGGWGQWPLRAVVISSAASRTNRLGLALLALALLASVAVAFAYGRWRRGASRIAAPPEQTGEPVALPGPAPKADAVDLSPRTRRVTGAAIWVLAIGLCALYLLSTSGLVNLVIVALLGLLFLARPQLAPPLIAASLPWWQRTQPLLRWQFGLFEILAWLGLLAWFGRIVLAWLAGRRKSMIQRESSGLAGRSTGWTRAIDITVIGLFLAGLLASIFAAEKGVALREFRIVFFFGLVFYLLITRGSQGTVRSRAGSLVAGLLAGATVASLAGLWQFVTGQGRVDVEGVGRIAAFYGSPNNLALILDRAVPLAAALALFGVSFWRSAGRSRWPRITLAVVAGITLAAAVATFSKGAYMLGLPAGLAVVLAGGAWRSRKRWPLWLLLGLVLVGGLVLVVLFRTPRFAGLFDFQGGTSFFRIKLWRGALNMALDHPLLGVGPDNFLYAYRTRYVLPSGWQELNLSHPHNLILDLWTRLGVVGLVAGLASLIVAIGAGWKLLVAGRRVPGSPLDRSWPLFLGLLGGLVAAVAHGLIDNSLFLPDLMGWFVAALGLFWLHAGRAGQESGPGGSDGSLKQEV